VKKGGRTIYNSYRQSDTTVVATAAEASPTRTGDNRK